jgi:uncharacterized protein with GYD domain
VKTSTITIDADAMAKLKAMAEDVGVDESDIVATMTDIYHEAKQVRDAERQARGEVKTITVDNMTMAKLKAMAEDVGVSVRTILETMTAIYYEARQSERATKGQAIVKSSGRTTTRSLGTSIVSVLTTPTLGESRPPTQREGMAPLGMP